MNYKKSPWICLSFSLFTFTSCGLNPPSSEIGNNFRYMTVYQGDEKFIQQELKRDKNLDEKMTKFQPEPEPLSTSEQTIKEEPSQVDIQENTLETVIDMWNLIDTMEEYDASLEEDEDYDFVGSAYDPDEEN